MRCIAFVLSGLAATTAALPACRDSGAGVGSTRDGGRDAAAATDGGPSFDADCSDGGGGSALCPITSCGYIKSVATLGLTETARSGADGVCNQGRSCVAVEVTPAGDAISLTCVAPRAGGLDYGMACSTDAASAQRCKDDSLCVDAPGTTGAPFCTRLCRIDADCPSGSACLEYRHPLPNTSHALVGQCTPIGKLPDPICTAESACPAGQGCLRAGDRTLVRTCQAVTGARSLGDGCTASSQCRSGECLDREFRLPGSATRTFCSGPCLRNSDCGADQRCVAKVLGNNGTISDPLDDVVVGYCRSLFASPTSVVCQNDTECATAGLGGDTCHPTYGICYKASAVVGAACAHDEGCGLGGACAMGPTFAGGACVMEGCAPGGGATGTDVCPGAQSVCSQRASDEPLSRCYEGCSTQGGCSRNAQSYFCAPAKDGQPITICLSR
ncbi:MAG TPA: hypothetical protein VFH68_26305 [Polyangia bacterium]|nr:hypothetical protein [Polyangia bacterium]